MYLLTKAIQMIINGLIHSGRVAMISYLFDQDNLLATISISDETFKSFFKQNHQNHIFWSQLLKCENLLLFLVLFWTNGKTKQVF